MKAFRYLILLLCILAPVLLSVGAQAAVDPVSIPYIPDERAHFAEDLKIICEEAAKFPIQTKQDDWTFTWDELRGPLEAARERLALPLAERRPLPFSKAKIVVKATGAMQNACDAIANNTRLTVADIATLRELWKSSGYIRKLVDAGFMQALRYEARFVDGTPPLGITSVLSASEGVPAQPQVSTVSLEAAPAVGSLETRLVQGMADFLVSRAKAETAQFFQEYLAETLCTDTNEGEVKTVDYFQNLCHGLKEPDLALSLQGMGVFLRAAAKSDLENIPDVALADAMDRATTAAKPEIAEIAAVGRVALAVYHEGRTHRNPLELIRGLSELETFSCENKDQGCSKVIPLLRTGAILYRALERNVLFDDPDAKGLRVYGVIGAVFDAEKMLKHAAGSSPLKDVDVGTIINYIDAMNDLSRTVSRTVKTVKQLVDQSRMVEESDAGNRRQRLVALRVAMLDQVLTGLEQSTTILTNYPNLLGSITTHESVRDAFEDLRQIQQLGEAYVAEDRGNLIMKAIAVVNRMSTNLGGSDKLPTVVRTTMPVLAELANAQTSQEVQTVLQAAAAPVGSYRTKSLRRMCTINSFVGAAYARERYDSSSAGGDNSDSMLGFAPVGLHYSWPTPWKSKTLFRSWGAMISVLDFGPLMASRSGDDVDNNSNIGFKEVFSPGLYGTLNIAGPVTVGTGVARTPNLLKDAATGESLDSWRFQVFIAMDLTLFPF